MESSSNDLVMTEDEIAQIGYSYWEIWGCTGYSEEENWGWAEQEWARHQSSPL
ncbi:MAG: hypothetical protein M1541_10860 [Acidobacteria bacterium]|nr:hypothetical protein [Acidobacteriota bacterium]